MNKEEVERRLGDMYEVDWDKVNTLKDMKIILKACDFRFRRQFYDYDKIKHLLKLQGT
jgi:hypothetical protein